MGSIFLQTEVIMRVSYLMECMLQPAMQTKLHITNRFHGHGVLYFQNAGEYEGDWEFGKSLRVC